MTASFDGALAASQRRALGSPRLHLPITSIVEIVRPFGPGDLGHRVAGSTFETADLEQRAAEIARDVLLGFDTQPGTEALLVVRNGEVIARYDLAALALLADLLHLLAADAEIASAA